MRFQDGEARCLVNDEGKMVRRWKDFLDTVAEMSRETVLGSSVLERFYRHCGRNVTRGGDKICLYGAGLGIGTAI
jgi:hypothetical protein